MRAIGPNSSLRKHEQEMLFTGAKCKAHQKAEVQAIGELLLAQRKKMKTMRDELEDAEDDLVIANAMVSAKDYVRDRSLISTGAMIDAIHPGSRDKLFSKAPSVLAKLGYDKESDAIDQVLVKLKTFPENDPVRMVYEKLLAQQNQAFRKARSEQQEANLELTRIRTVVLRVKMDNDRFREQQFGALLAHVSKVEAEALFSLRTKSTKAKAASEQATETTGNTSHSPTPATTS